MDQVELDEQMENERRLTYEYGDRDADNLWYHRWKEKRAELDADVKKDKNFMSDSKKLGHAIKMARVESKKKQKDVADQANISTNYLCLVENGHRDPRLFTLCDICNAIGIEAWKVIQKAEEA